MKTVILLLFLIILLSQNSCKKANEVQPAVVITSPVSAITSSTASCGGNITSDGGSPVTNRGICWSTSQDPTVSGSKTSNGSGLGSFTADLTGLAAHTSYYARAYAVNSAGTNYGSSVSFSTSSEIATLTTAAISEVTTATAKGGGTITNDGGAAITARGICWSTSHNPSITDLHTTDGEGTGSFSGNLSGLSSNTYYYVRAYATNSAGTGYGPEILFATTGTVTDVEGNVYKTINIGTQVWMAENLRTTKYRNEDPLTNAPDGNQWMNSTTISGQYCWYNNDQASNKSSYGALYNWFAVTDSRKLAPTGWHIPSEAEWRTLINYLGGENVAGAKLKESGTLHWTLNDGTTNETGFTGLPGGSIGDSFLYLGQLGYYWSSTEINIDNVIHFRLDYSSLTRLDPGGKRYGFSVRCIKD